MRWPLLIPFVAIVAYGQGVFGVEPNAGQFGAEVLYFQRTDANPLTFTRDTLRYGNGMEVQIVGMSAQASTGLVRQLPTVYNFYPGPKNQRQYGEVVVRNVYAGIHAEWSAGGNRQQIGALGGEQRLTFTLEAGAKLSDVRVKFKTQGDPAFAGPGGVWFTGGVVPGVFIVEARATQGNPAVSVPANLVIEGTDTVSVAAPGLDPSRPSEVVVAFPSYRVGVSLNLPEKASDGNRYLYGTTGSLAQSEDLFVGRVAEDGTLLWLSIVGGQGRDVGQWMGATADGVVVQGYTSSQDFPVTSNAVARTVPADQTPYLTLFDRQTGVLLSSTLLPTANPAGVRQQLVQNDGDVVVGGPAGDGGYVTRWRPKSNQILFHKMLQDPIVAVRTGLDGGLLYAANGIGKDPSVLRIGALSLSGSDVGRMVEVPLPFGSGESASLGAVSLEPMAGQAVVGFVSWRSAEYFRGWIGSFSLVDGTTRFLREYPGASGVRKLAGLANGEIVAEIGMSNQMILPVSANASLVAPCQGSLYYMRLSASGNVLFASYTGAEDYEEPVSAKPLLACVASTASRIATSMIVPGQMVTLTGGGFGPMTVVYAAPDETRKFPVRLAGYQVKIGGIDAPMIAVGRGVVAVQVPFELTQAADVEIAISGPDAPAGLIRVSARVDQVELFTTGDARNATGLAAAAALNEDGSVNSQTNPAKRGSVVSVFGTGLPRLDAQAVSGGLFPLDQVYPWAYLATAYNATLVYLGSAPGLSNTMFQANLKLNDVPSRAEAWPMPIGIKVGYRSRDLYFLLPSVIVWVR